MVVVSDHPFWMSANFLGFFCHNSPPFQHFFTPTVFPANSESIFSIMFQYYLLKIGGPVTHNWCPKLPNLGGYVMLLLLLLELLTFRHFTEESLKNVKIDGLTGRETSHLFFWHFFSWCGKPENNNFTLEVVFFQKIDVHFSNPQIYFNTI